MTLTGAAFLFAFLVAMVLALFRHPIYGLYAYIGEFYLHPASRWWGESLPNMRWSLTAAGVTILAILLRSPKGHTAMPWYRTPPAIIMIIFVAWFWLGSLWALDRAQHMPMASLLLKYIFVFYLIYRLMDTPGRINGFLVMHVAGCMYLGVVALGSFSGGRLDGVGGPGIDDSNTLGMHLATGVVTGAMLVMHLRDWRKYFSIIAVALAMNAIVMTGSRGAFLGLVAGGLVLFKFRPSAYNSRFYLYATLGLALLVLVASGSFWARMGTLKAVTSENQSELDNSARSRIAMFEAQIQMAKEYPLGSGHRGSEVLSKNYLDAGYMTAAGVRSSHNSFMTVLVEQGIPGVILFLAICGWVGSTLMQLRRALQQQGDLVGFWCICGLLQGGSAVLDACATGVTGATQRSACR
jgi:O-Antigen ligase